MSTMAGTDLDRRLAAGSVRDAGRESSRHLPRYAQYKESGVSWVGEVPVHWQARPLKYLARLVTGVTPPTDVHENYSEVGFPWIRPEDINETGKATLASKFLSEDGAQIARHIAPLSTLICCIGTIGKAGIIEGFAATNQQITAASFRGLARYFYYATCAARTEIETSATGNVLKILNIERLGRIRFPDPPEAEQSVIAAFLDRETGKIDALIAEQETLLILLAEKRQATISHAVTRGLNPNAPMKDSGVPWLGEVPAHWIVRRVKYLIRDGIAGPYGSSLTKSMYVSEGYRVYGQQQVIPNDFSVGDYYISEEKFFEMQRYQVMPGDVLISVMGTIGQAALVPDDVEPGIINPRLVLYRVIQEVIRPRYLQVFLNNPTSQKYFSLAAQGTTMDGLNMGSIGELYVAVPPCDEQNEIMDLVDSEDGRISRLVLEVKSAIDLLRERRSALIAAAVTGKIDVRQAA